MYSQPWSPQPSTTAFTPAQGHRERGTNGCVQSMGIIIIIIIIIINPCKPYHFGIVQSMGMKHRC
jgi:hypothetical protein